MGDWNVGQQGKKGLNRKKETAILVGVIQGFDTKEQVDEYLDELEFLAYTAGAKTLKRFQQKLDKPNPKTFIGKGKLEEIRKYVKSNSIDLVIFDEASQCFAEKGIPAIYRSRQTVIVGDTQQLRPHDLYRPRWEEEFEEQNEGENLAVLEVDSLLDLGKQYLPEEQLQGHYRSKSLELIAFSNEHFYQNKLKMIPEYEEFMRGEPAIQYIKVDGMWHKNTNQEEALKVVQLVKGLLADGKTSIGVITFNFKQQQLIQDLLDLLEINLPESLFVKNIENVQGDERDNIIFSVAYAPNPQGQFRVQFGLLNQQGGENRLNVAVSRAREQIILVSSILPHQLKVEETKNWTTQRFTMLLVNSHLISE